MNFIIRAWAVFFVFIRSLDLPSFQLSHKREAGSVLKSGHVVRKTTEHLTLSHKKQGEKIDQHMNGAGYKGGQQW